MSNIDERVGSAAKWSIFTEIIVKIISPITNMILARILVPEEFGVVATVTMIVSFADIFTDAGFQKYVVQHQFKTKEAFLKSNHGIRLYQSLSIREFFCIVEI